MNINLKCKAVISNMISLIYQYTGIYARNLTESVVALMYLRDETAKRLRGVIDGSIEELTLKDTKGIKKLPQSGFYNNTNLRYIELPEDLTELGNACFYGCGNVDMPFIPEGVKKFGISTFYNCYNLSVDKLPDGITSIGATAFYNCQKLRISEIPEGVTIISREAFAACTSIESLTFKGTPTSIDRGAFGGCTNLSVINVPWAEGTIASAPWGATNAVVNYNYTGE